MLRIAAALAATGVAFSTATVLAKGGSPLPIPATANDFFQPGTQTSMPGVTPIVNVSQCTICHANYNEEVEPFAQWTSSMLAQSARDPVFWAAVSIANQDVVDGGQFCIRCHAPGAFLEGRHLPADGSGFTATDRQGVSCNICHRMVNPNYQPGISPAQDEPIVSSLASQGLIPMQSSNARIVLDPNDTRRGPFDPASMPFNPHFGNPPAPIIESHFHRESQFCWTCHDVSNPLTVRQKDGSYMLGPLDEPHPTADHFDMFPLHRTFAEWENSYYNTQGGVQHNGRFGGNHPTGVMNTCQDCHMPRIEGFGCSLPGFPLRPDIPQHSFLGANTWVLGAVRNLFDDTETGLSASRVEAAHARNIAFLQAASDLELSQDRGTLTARVVNQTGHKLPTGNPDGRRVWINVRFLDADDNVIAERGRYDYETATLIDEGADTTVFEAHLGIDEAQADATGMPVGRTFHFALANTVLKDNRIPPRGFSNQIAAEKQCLPVGETYANGQHWHDTPYAIPSGARKVLVAVYYQVTSREFAEFLRDTNQTDDRGQIAYDQWVLNGRSAPVMMDLEELDLFSAADFDQNGVVDFDDLLTLLTFWGSCPQPPFPCPFDLDGDGSVGFSDLIILLSEWTV